MPTYGRVPIALERGRGCRVWDVNGKESLDALGGIAVNTLGHNHPKLVPALQEQIATLIHTSNYYHVPGQETLATLLTERAGMTNVFFCSTGLEANEAAIKIARKYGVDKGIEKPEIVVYDHAFHGRSIATMSATANPKVRNGFGPLLDGFTRVAPNDYEALLEATEGNPNIVAVMMEPIQGEGGLHPFPHAKREDWRLVTAGQRVQIIKRDPEKGAVLQFGTEIVGSEDGSIAALLGASPGASTAPHIMLNLLKKSFPEQMASAEWKSHIQKIVPSYGNKINEDAGYTNEIRRMTSSALKLPYLDVPLSVGKQTATPVAAPETAPAAPQNPTQLNKEMQAL